jgi:hypothetical protein
VWSVFSRGVLIAVNQTLTSSIVFTGNDTEFLSIKINLKHGKSAIICATYRPPNRTDDEYTNSLITKKIANLNFLSPIL